MVLKLGVSLAAAGLLTLWAGSACAGETEGPDRLAAAHTGSSIHIRLAQFVLPPNRAFKPIGGDRPYLAWLTPTRPANARG
jgi:hypothetical protein